MWRLLRAGAFRWMWAGETVSMLGDRVHEIALAWLVLGLTGSPLALGSVLLAGALPRAVLLLIGGAASDRLSARLLMLSSNLVRALLVALLFALVATGRVRLWQLYALEIGFGIADAFFYPAAGSIVPAVVSRNDLTPANALLGTSEQVTRLTGPALGGVLVAVAGTAGAFLVNSLTFVAAAAGLLPAPAARGGREADKGLWSGVKAGLRYAARDRELRAVLAVVSVGSLTYSGIFAVGLPALARNRFPQGSLALGAMLAAWGAGQLLGAVSAGITGLPRRWGLLIIGMMLAESAAFALLGLVPTFWIAAAVLAVLGFGVAYSSDVALPSWIQGHSRPDMLGRVNSLLELTRESIAPISLAGMGLLATLSLSGAFIAAAGIMLAAALLAARSASVRGLV